jgi:hypothetical protein
MMRLKRIATAVACALLLAFPAPAQVIGSGHVLGNGTSSPASPTDTPLLQILNQAGSGVTLSGNSTKLGTVGGSTTPVNGDCTSWNNGNLGDAGGPCTIGGGGGTVTAGTAGQIAVYPSNGTVVAGINKVPLANGGGVCISLEQFGGGPSASGTTNVSTYANFLAALPTQGGCLQFSTGVYSFSGVLTANLPASLFNIDIRGTGANSTELLWPSGGGMTFNYTNPQNSVHARDFSMVTGAAGGSAAINLTQSSGLGNFEKSTFSDISMRGSIASDFWAWGYETGGVSGVDIYSPIIYSDNISTGGGGIMCSGPGGATGFSIMVNVVNPIIGNAPIGIEMGANCQGLTIVNMNITNGGIGIKSPAGAAGTSQTQLQILGGQISLNTGDAIALLDSIGNVIIQGTDLFVPSGQNGINVGTVLAGNITGNSITCTSATSTNGMAINGVDVAITGNEIAGCASGITFFSSSGNNNTQSNQYNSDTVKVTNGGAASNVFGSCTGVTGTCSGGGATP